MFPSVVIPTYNRRPILEKCLRALENQDPAASVDRYEVVVVDDGSTDGTAEWLRQEAASFPHVRLIEQDHGGAAAGRNRGVDEARGDVIVFIDSDLVVTAGFLAAHATALERHWRESGNRLCFTYGAVIQHQQLRRSHQRAPQAQRSLLGLFRHRQCGHRPRPAGALRPV